MSVDNEEIQLVGEGPYGILRFLGQGKGQRRGMPGVPEAERKPVETVTPEGRSMKVTKTGFQSVWAFVLREFW